MWEETRIEFGKNRAGLARRFSWPAIFAGAAVAFGVTILLGLLGAGLGASTVNPLQETNPLEGLGVGAIAWVAVSGIIAFFVAGWLAAYGSGALTRTEAWTHGLVTWAVATFVGLWMMSGAAGTLISGGAGMIGRTLSSGARAASQSSEFNERLRAELERRGITAESLREQAQSPEGRAEADRMVRQAGQAIAHGVSKAALGGFGILLVNLLASLGGALSAFYRRRTETVTATTERVA